MSGPLADAAWRLIPAERCAGPAAMAYDDAAAETAAAADGLRTARLYRWAPPTLSLGYGQDADSVGWDACERLGIDVVRRPTGGGGILHGADLSYSVAVPASDVPGDVSAAYRLLLEPILDAFERLGVPVAFADDPGEAGHRPSCYLRSRHPAHDLVADGRKICGNAQRRTDEAVVQHGSLAVAPDPERRAAVFADPGVRPEDFRSRTATLAEFGVTRSEAAAALGGALAEWTGAERGSWTEAERRCATTRAERQYANDAWTRRREDSSP